MNTIKPSRKQKQPIWRFVSPLLRVFHSICNYSLPHTVCATEFSWIENISSFIKWKCLFFISFFRHANVKIGVPTLATLKKVFRKKSPIHVNTCVIKNNGKFLPKSLVHQIHLFTILMVVLGNTKSRIILSTLSSCLFCVEDRVSKQHFMHQEGVWEEAPANTSFNTLRLRYRSVKLSSNFVLSSLKDRLQILFLIFRKLK